MSSAGSSVQLCVTGTAAALDLLHFVPVHGLDFSEKTSRSRSHLASPHLTRGWRSVLSVPTWNTVEKDVLKGGSRTDKLKYSNTSPSVFSLFYRYLYASTCRNFLFFAPPKTRLPLDIFTKIPLLFAPSSEVTVSHKHSRALNSGAQPPSPYYAHLF
jgi:hypothetical protein